MIDDATLQQNVLDELDWEPKVDAAHIGVTASEGAVTLSGHVSSYPEKFAAIEAVRKIRGVRAIADDIEVHLRDDLRTDDSDVAERIAHVLEWNVTVPGDSVKAKVSNGFVNLTGEVDWDHERRQIERQVRHVRGVKGLSNLIKIRQRASAPDVKKKIEEALQRNASLEASHIRVSVAGDKVTLDGEVKALYERGLAERAAWTAPGVRQVVDHLRIA
jgi:osmotically-inducible protein OsmY